MARICFLSLWLAFCLDLAQCALPNLPDCIAAQDAPFSTFDPATIFGNTSEVGVKATPVRVGSLRQDGPLPTGHFAEHIIKQQEVFPVILTPYQAILNADGAVYDTYTMDRWTDPGRSDFMEQQTPTEQDKPWVKLTSMGSDMRQFTTGPDGNPFADFKGSSGIRISISGAIEPELTSFGELYANFRYTSDDGVGSMEVPLVRGASLLTHRLVNANPVVKPYCLSSINNIDVNFECPLAPSLADAGTGFLTGQCSGGTLTITLHNSKPIKNINLVQWAAETSENWSNVQFKNCNNSTCSLDNGGRTVKISVPNSSGTMAFAVQYLDYALPVSWSDSPEKVTCSARREVRSADVVSETEAERLTARQNRASNNITISQPTTKFVMELNEPGNALPAQTRKFVLYFSSPVIAYVDTAKNQITLTPPTGGRFSGLAQIAFVGRSARGDDSQNSFFDDQAGMYSDKPEVKYCVSSSQNKGYLSFEWNPKGLPGKTIQPNNLLMVAMPHHALLLEKQNPGQLKDTPFTFKGYNGSDWLMEYDVLHTEIAPDPRGVASVKANSTQLQAILAAIERDAQNDDIDRACVTMDSYFGGKEIGKSTRFASLSRAFGTNHYLTTDESLRNCLEKWLRVQDTLSDKWKFKYENVWGGLFLRASDAPEIDWYAAFGFPFYNDHHFHLGYFIYALAYYVKHYPQWGQTHKDRIYSLARDVGNPSTKDPFFPVARQKDIYTGFSWATGVVPGVRQEESASEAINCYHALAALGDAFNDKNLEQTGHILLSTEIFSVREYWQVRAHNRANFPPAIQQTGTVGMVTEPAFYAYTLNWPCEPNIFPQRHACLVGIQIIPITPVSKYWVDQEWASSIQDTCTYAIWPQTHPDYSKAENSTNLQKPVASGWAAFCYVAMAPLDDYHQSLAADYLKDKKPQDLVGGTGAASTLLFIYANT